ncbi:MAG: putative sulfate exporter family transporter [Cyclobacteriaceae bacterium]|nr:putative sulfate exporter family transporter [Cyclobacteriaceae bacterium]
MEPDIHKNRQILAEQSELPFKTVAGFKAEEQLDQLTGAKTSFGKAISKLTARPKSWSDNPLVAFYIPEKPVEPDKIQIVAEAGLQVDKLETKALFLEENARAALFQNDSLNLAAASAALAWHKADSEFNALQKKSARGGFSLFPNLLVFALILSGLFGIGAYFMGHKYLKFIIGFLGVFVIGLLAFLLESQTDMKNIGMGYALWAILLGLIISNTVGTPSWIKPGLLPEYFIKTGLVLLGSELLLGKIMAIGLPGIFVAWVVTPIVLIGTYWFGQKVLKISSKSLNITISADMSVCGVSAAIATAAACNAKKEELTMAVGLSMVFTSIMMVALPAFIKAVGMPEVLGGAWIGGTIDATGAVVAAGAVLGDKALNVAATIKMIQNILIGIIAFGVAVYWAAKVENTKKSSVGIGEIWKRFPKFVLGFIGASLLFTVLSEVLPEDISSAFIDQGIVSGYVKDLHSWLFCLAFASIGLSINFKELRHQFSGGKPLILYACGQIFNLILTLLMAYLMFYIVFPDITKTI